MGQALQSHDLGPSPLYSPDLAQWQTPQEVQWPFVDFIGLRLLPPQAAAEVNVALSWFKVSLSLLSKPTTREFGESKNLRAQELPPKPGLACLHWCCSQWPAAIPIWRLLNQLTRKSSVCKERHSGMKGYLVRWLEGNRGVGEARERKRREGRQRESSDTTRKSQTAIKTKKHQIVYSQKGQMTWVCLLTAPNSSLQVLFEDDHK